MSPRCTNFPSTEPTSPRACRPVSSADGGKATLRCSYGGTISIVDPNQTSKVANPGSVRPYGSKCVSASNAGIDFTFKTQA